MFTEEELKKKVKDVLMGNMIMGYSKKHDYQYCYTKPAKERYPFQYFWDTCFHIFMLLAIEEYEHARRHLETLLMAQKDDGFIGNIIYWKHVMPARFADFLQMKVKDIFHLNAPHMSDIIQPPLLARAALEIYEHTGDREFMKKMLPKIKKYYKWLAENRDFDGDKLLTIITTFESGMDWKPTYDEVVNFHHGKANRKLFRKVIWIDFRNFIRNYDLKRIRDHDYFRVKDVGFNSIYAQNLKELSKLCKLMGDEEAQYFEDLSKQVTQAILERMYDEEDEAFYDLAGDENKKLRVLTPTIFYPLIIEELAKEPGRKVIERHFYKSEEFDTPFPIPSVAKNDDSFDPGSSIYLWRGPTWIVNNWFLHSYLIHKEHHEKARTLMEGMVKLIEKSGFREYYNPFTGEGYGARDFTWGGLILVMLQNETKNKFQKDLGDELFG